MNALWPYLQDLVGTMLLGIGLPLTLGTLIEQINGRGLLQHRRQFLVNVSCQLCLIVLCPLSAFGAISTANAIGGGMIDISAATGWRFFASVAALIVVMDLAEYLFHRAQHALPVLWAMHSLHHSDEAMNVTTTGRHFWVEPTIKALTVYPLVGLFLKADATVFAVYSLVSFYNYVSHMDVRISLGRYSWILNTPHYHRLHHSSLAAHYDTNFAALFPIFDVLSGAYRRPLPDEYPKTGLTPSDLPSGLGAVLTWPLRGLIRRTAANPTQLQPVRS